MTEFHIDDPSDEDEFTELADAQIGRIDLVGKGANGMPFLIAKGAGGLLSAEAVQELLDRNAVPDPVPDPVEHVTISGSPAAVMKMMWEAAQRHKVTKADESTASINDLPDSDFAYIEPGGTKDADGKTEPRDKRHFPIQDAAHVRDALSRAPQSPFGDKALPKIRAAAKRFGIDVAKEATMTTTDDVAKAKVNIDEPLDGAGDSSPMPGSPEWEAIDAATASKWIGVLGRAKNAVCLLAEREMQEAAVGDLDGADNAFNLQDASSAIDAAISILAPYAVGEEMDSQDVAKAAADVAKVLAGAVPPIDVIEQLAPVVKAGRVLSGQNESKLRDAVALLQSVLATLPAPVDDSGQSVAKEADMAPTPEATVEQVADGLKKMQEAGERGSEALEKLKAAVDAANAAAPQLTLGLVHKAKGDPVVVVFNAEGKLIGVVDPDDLLPVSDSAKTDDGSSSDASASDASTDASADAGTADASAAPADDAAAAPADAGAQIPGTQTVAAPAPAAPDDDNVTKSEQSDGAAALAALLREALNPIAEQFAQVDGLATVVKGLQERVEEIAKMPDDRKSPALNGVASAGRANESSADSHADLRKAVEEAKTQAEKRDALQRLAYAEIKGRFTPGT